MSGLQHLLTTDRTPKQHKEFNCKKPELKSLCKTVIPKTVILHTDLTI